ncbi:MAG TPA: tRNA guanosine(34) transglycosylase Tgt [Solirubrobacteraceae bacterium]
MPALRIIARDPGSAARAGVVDTPHGPIETPAFVPLATKASVRGLTSQEVSGLGYEMVLGNTFHLFLNPGHELIARLGGLHRFMGWRGPIITDSGGFQVFSMGHGTVADEIKGRRAGGREGAILAIEEDGVRFRSYVDGDVRFMGPETSMEVQEGLGSDIVVAFDECTPFNVDREYTAASTERTHRWLDRCIRWRDQHARTDSLFYGIVQGGVYEDLRRSSTEAVVASGCEGVAIGGSLGSEKAQMYEVVGWSTQELDRLAPDRPRHLLGIGDVDDLIRGVELGIDTFDCAMPTRIARHGVAIVPEPEARWRVALDRPVWRGVDEPLLPGCPCSACAGGLSRAYLHYLARNRDLTGARLLTEHNLTYLRRLMGDLRAAVLAGTLGETARAFRSGAAPGAVGAGSGA